MPRIDLDQFPLSNATGYPPPLDRDVAGRWYRSLGPGSGLTDLGVSLVTLEPGAWSSQRHVHDCDDEFLVMLSGEAVLVEDEGRVTLRSGDCASFPKNGSAHHLINESARPCSFVCVAPPDSGDVRYPDVDLYVDFATDRYVRKDGTPY
jgi:uncharacterized cupin superfamily protein